MCGFVGYINKGKKDKKVLKNMCDAIMHRGPDEDGYYIDNYVSLGFRRLSIIDLSNGSQPIYNEDNTKVLIFNGEIYNYKDIRKDLVKAGHKFKTESDSEVLLHGYEEYKEDLLNKLRGMFAFVIYDKENHEIFGARDYFGIKPLYYYQNDGEFMFSSEIKAFLKHPNFKKEFNESTLSSYLAYQYAPLDQCFFKNVYKLPPAHYFKMNKDGLEIKRYFNFEFKYEDDKSLDYWVEEIKKTMKDSVKAHKISDVEVGSFLSSGIDSSYIVTLADVDKTFTVGFDNGEKYNEISYAEELSNSLGIKNVHKVIGSSEFFDKVKDIMYYMDEPVADPSAIALYFVAKLASENVKVVLSGEGADELFQGYNVYRESLGGGIYNNVPFGIRKGISKVLGVFPRARGVNFFVRKGKKVEERFIGNANSIFSNNERKKILKNKEYLSPIENTVKHLFDDVKNMDEISKMQYIDLNTWLVGDILQKSDKMSMANSLEVRVPFLDRKVLELAMRIPTKYKVCNGTTKYALRKAASEVLPEKWSSKKKLGFPVPIRVWLKEDKYYNMISDAFNSDVARKYFNEKELHKLLEDHKNNKKDNSRKIWIIYAFVVWYNEYFK